MNKNTRNRVRANAKAGLNKYVARAKRGKGNVACLTFGGKALSISN